MNLICLIKEPLGLLIECKALPPWDIAAGQSVTQDEEL